MSVRRFLFRITLIGSPILGGVVLAAWLVAHRDAPETREQAAPPTPVSVIVASEVPYTPRATGFGEARPARTWRAAPQVAGEIVEKHPELASGALLAEGAVLFRIDRTDYELAVAEAQASIAAKEAEASELDSRRLTTERSLAIERRRLEVAERELERQRTLLARGTVPQATVDREERDYLQQRQAVQELENALTLLPAERRRLAAEVERDRARRAQAQRDIAHTVITAPFDLRVAEADVEPGQVVQVGETLMRGDAVSATEVEAQFPLEQFRALLQPMTQPSGTFPDNLRKLLAAMNLRAEVRLRGADTTARWAARVDRLSEAIDPRTRTVGVVVVVDRPYEQANPPERPPLVKGMYVEVRLCAPKRSPAIVVPRSAVRQGQLYVVGPDDRLQVREALLSYEQDDFAVIRDGVAAGERVILTDIVPAVEGMRLAPQVDDEAKRALVRAAEGTEVCP